MGLISEEVKETARLAMLALEEAELPHLATQLQEIMGLLAILEDLALPEQETLPAVSPGEAKQPTQGLSQEQVLALAPDSCRGLVRVPKVTEDE
jgi:aspartyl-tRNA(Asn)/glutamyl-tRNA(Gln) amidotransferase subunit C